MNLKGILDFSLGNFLCLRGFARMGDLYTLSEPDPSFQRDLLKLHEKKMVAFLLKGEFLRDSGARMTIDVLEPFSPPEEIKGSAVFPPS